jgi:uncharacterized protein (DUF1501 family)
MMKKTTTTSFQAASRREFLKRSSALSIAGAAAPWAMNLAAMGEAAAQSADDYKALVCVFLFGGNDHGNTIIPYDAASYTPRWRCRVTRLLQRFCRRRWRWTAGGSSRWRPRSRP